MNESDQSVVGIDVGGERKGFHAVALRDGSFVEMKKSTNPADVVKWCEQHDATVVAVDAPCGWSAAGSSRRAERELEVAGKRIHCFATPTRECARKHEKGFYGWVLNGEKLYQLLTRFYILFDGTRRKGPVVFETFPQAVVCTLAGRLVSAKAKTVVRRNALKESGYDVSGLPNIDFVDAALCALTAENFLKGYWLHFGDSDEGVIVVPSTGAVSDTASVSGEFRTYRAPQG